MNKTELKGIIEYHENAAYSRLETKSDKLLDAEKDRIVREALPLAAIESVSLVAAQLKGLLNKLDATGVLELRYNSTIIGMSNVTDRAISVEGFIEDLKERLDVRSYKTLGSISVKMLKEREALDEEYGKLYTMLRNSKAKDVEPILKDIGFDMEKTTYARPEKYELSVKNINVKALGIGG